jgi:hypothetical protein
LAALRERAAETGERLGGQLDRIMPAPTAQQSCPADDAVSALAPDRVMPSLSVHPMVQELGK